MKRFINISVCILFCACCLFYSFAEAADTVNFKSEPQQRLDVRFRLFRTDNMWSYLLLDTSDGRVWHVTFTNDKNKGARLKIPINDKTLIALFGSLGIRYERSNFARFRNPIHFSGCF